MSTAANNPESDLDENGQPRRKKGWSFADFVPNLGFGSIIILGLLAVGAYFLGATERGKALLTSLFEKLPESWQSTISGWFTPDPMKQAFAANPGAQERLMGYAKAQPGFSITDPASAITPDFIYTVLTKEKPKVIGDLLKGNAGGDTDNPVAKKALESVRALVSDPAKLSVLLSSAHRANVFAALEALSPIAFPPGRLGAFIETVGMQGDQPTPYMKRILATLLSGDPQAFPTVVSSLLQTHALALSNLFTGVDPATITDPTLRQLLPIIQNKQAMGAAQKVEQQLGEQGGSLIGLLERLQSPDTMVATLLDRDSRNVLKPLTGKLAVLANEVSASLTVPANATPDEKTALAQKKLAMDFLGTPVQTAHGRQAVNAQALMGFFDRIDGNPFNSANAVARTRTEGVIHGLLGKLTQNADTGALLSADNLSAFFGNKANADAFGTLLQQIHTERLPAELQAKVKILRDNWEGIKPVLGDRASLTWLFDQEKNKDKPKGFIASRVDGMPDWAKLSGAHWLPTAITGMPDTLGDQIYYLDAVKGVLGNVGVRDGSAAPVAAPSVASQSQRR